MLEANWGRFRESLTWNKEVAVFSCKELLMEESEGTYVIKDKGNNLLTQRKNISDRREKYFN